MDFGEEQVSFLQLRAFKLISAREYEAALETTEEALQLAAGGDQRAAVLRLQAMALIQMEEPEPARTRIDEAWKIAGSKQPATFAPLLAATGEIDRARRLLSEADAQPGNAFPVALGYLYLGEISNAFEWLAYGIEEHNAQIVGTLRTGAFWDDVRDEPRFQALIRLLEAEESRTDR